MRPCAPAGPHARVTTPVGMSSRSVRTKSFQNTCEERAQDLEVFLQVRTTVNTKEKNYMR